MSGQLRVNEITNEDGTGSPSFPNGIAASEVQGLGLIEILDTQIFTASGTWTKPSGVSADDTLILAVIGGGGSGATFKFNGRITASGGGGGGVMLCNFKVGDLPSTVAVTVGAGGAAVQVTASSGSSVGNPGGTSSFGTLVSATGGSGGRIAGADSGVATALGASGGIAWFLSTNATTGNMNSFGGRSRDATSGGATVTDIHAGLTGGGGGSGNNGSTAATLNDEAATGCLFGDGGNGGRISASDGVAPGGGGGGSTSHNTNTISGAGARGEVQCYIVRGRVSASTFYGID
jgi:hypothetical protein